MKEKLKDKKVIAGLAIGVIVIISIIIFVAMSMNTSTLKLKNKEVAVEYGSAISLAAKDYLNNDTKLLEKVKVESTAKNEAEKEYPAIGEYEITLTYKDLSEKVKVIVKDTTAPTLKDFKDTIETAKDVKLDYTKTYAAEDLSEVIITCDDTNVKYDTVGEYKATLKATDNSKNETTKEVTVKVVEPTIKIDKESTSLYVKETLVLKTTITGKEQRATFKSSNEKIATVDENGKVTAKAKGITTIAASANGKDTACKLTVKDMPSGSTTKKEPNGNTVVVPPSSNNSGSGSSNTSDGTAKISMEAFNLINSERTKLGLEKISYASNLEGTALARAKVLTKNFSHSGSGSYYQNGVGRSEVITQLNSANTANKAVSNWMNSASHKAAIMDQSNTSMIVAYCNNCWVCIMMYSG